MGMREARAEIEFARSEAAEGAASALRDQLAEATQVSAAGFFPPVGHQLLLMLPQTVPSPRGH